ncbi:MAG: tRNA (adenosine(37)-N6)-threonylcarbamoyltransferase complex dimerization subunit type 1 TsaB [Terracidiphilus sp.]
MSETLLVLGIDTCGPSGSVALGRLNGVELRLLGQTELAGRSYSATLVAAVAELLSQAGVELKKVKAIVAVNGPGSFTGVRVGLSAVKGLAEPGGIPVVAVSRLAVLANKCGCAASALDAHRGEIFLRVPGRGGEEIELLAGRIDLQLVVPPGQVAVCDESAAALLASVWPQASLLHVSAPTAADALMLAAPRILAGEFVDLALLDGHYLRRSDAEIFGEPASAGAQRA